MNVNSDGEKKMIKNITANRYYHETEDHYGRDFGFWSEHL